MKITGTAIIHKGKKFNFATHRLLSSSGEEMSREYIDHPGSAVMVPCLPDGRLVMVRQYRHSIDRQTLELPAGTANWGEPFEQTAVRELAEETGYRTARVTWMIEIFPLPGATNERMAFYRCEDLTAGDADMESDEEIQVELVRLEDALKMVQIGEIRDAKTILGLWMEEKSRLSM